MKKVLSIILIAAMLLSVCVIHTFAEDSETTEYMYYDKAVDYLDKCSIYWMYYELYYHYSEDDSENPDWTLVYFYFDELLDFMKRGTLIGNRVYWNKGIYTYVPYGYSVYITELNTFINLDDDNLDNILQYCPDFLEVMDELNYGQQIGDVDDNGKVDVMDATYIQRYIAEYKDTFYARYHQVPPFYSYYHFYEVNVVDIGNYNFSIADFDRDSTTTIMDATAIQMKLAKVEVA